MPRSYSEIDTLFLPDRGPRWWPLSEIARARRSPRAWRIAALWSVAVALSIVAGVANLRLGWNAI